MAIGLKTDLEIAEIVKLKHASLADATKSGRVSVDYERRNHVFEAGEVSMIVEARVDEILDFVEKELKKVHRSRKLPGGVVLVGGTSKIPGIASFTKEKLQLPARLGSLQNVTGLVDEIKDPSFITAVGLMSLDMLFAEQDGGRGSQKMSNGSLMSGLSGLLKRFK